MEPTFFAGSAQDSSQAKNYIKFHFDKKTVMPLLLMSSFCEKKKRLRIDMADLYLTT